MRSFQRKSCNLVSILFVLGAGNLLRLVSEFFAQGPGANSLENRPCFYRKNHFHSPKIMEGTEGQPGNKWLSEDELAVDPSEVSSIRLPRHWRKFLQLGN